MAHETSSSAQSEASDAFALLLEEIDHEDLARSMRHETARTTTASTAAPPPMATGSESYHLLSSAQAAAYTPPAELYVNIDAFGTAQWQQQPLLEAQEPAITSYPTHQVGSPLLHDTLNAELASSSANVESVSTPTAANDAQSPVLERNDSTSRCNSTDDEKSSPQQQTQQQTTPTQPRKPMENSTRKRQKEELAYLRQKVLELETELRVMKDRARATALSRPHGDGDESDSADTTSTSAAESSAPSSADGAAPRPSSSSNSSSDSAATAPETRVAKVSLWERVAKRQLLEKQKAEMKNLKLKTALEDQLKIAKSLEKVLRKRPSATVRLTSYDSHRCTVRDTSVPHGVVLSRVSRASD